MARPGRLRYSPLNTSVPGIYQTVGRHPKIGSGFYSGVPVFIAFLNHDNPWRHSAKKYQRLEHFLRDFEKHRHLFALTFLKDAVEGFFENGGRACYVYEIAIDRQSPAASGDIARFGSLLEPLEEIDEAIATIE